MEGYCAFARHHGGHAGTTATITYADGNPADTRLDSGLTAALGGFNTGKTTSLILGGTLETPEGMEAAGAVITDWKTVDGNSVDAEI